MNHLARTRPLAALTLLALAACVGRGGMAPDKMAGMSNAGMGTPAAVGSTVMVGGEPMLPTRTIVENAVNSKDHTTLVAAVKAADLVGPLSGPGPLTVFAPTNAAFDALPPGTVGTLLKPENKAKLARVLTYHVVPGRLDGAALRQQVEAGGGKASLKTLEGGQLTVAMNGPRNLVVTDEAGNTAEIATYDVYQSNGVIHVVDRVLMPR